MSKKNMTRRALFASVISLILCCAMLVGTTFAWFTDSVTSGKNQIVAGNLDIELEYSKDMKDGSWATVKGITDLFEKNTLWEPGHTEVVYLKISNLGTLALKYQLAMNFTETEGTNVDGNTFKLSQYLKYDIVDVTAAYADRDTARNAVSATAQTLATYTANGSMAAGDASKTIALVVYMPETVGNEANYKTGTNAPVIDLKIILNATQKTNESDSFGPDYDDDAVYADATYVAEGQKTLAQILAEVNSKEDETVLITLNNDVEWETGAGNGSTPWVDENAAVKNLVVDANGHTITATGAGVGEIRMANGGTLTIKNGTIVDKSISYAEDSWEFTYLEFAGNLVFKNVKFTSGISVDGESAVFTNCSFDSKEDSVYGVWVSNGDASFTTCTFTGTRGLKTHEAYSSEVGTLTIDNCIFGPLSKKPGVAIGTLNADTTVIIKNSAFGGTQPGDQSNFKYETDTDVTTFNFVDENNTVSKTETVGNATDLATILSGSGASGAGNTVINITSDIDLEGTAWTPVYVNGYTGADVITIDGQGHTITGLTAPLFEGGFAGGSGIVIKNLTIADSNIVSSSTQGSGAFIECVDSMNVITLENCHLKNSTLSGSRTGGLIGWTAGYNNENDGPVKLNVTINNCSVVGCTLNATGSLGGIIGHSGGNAWTFTTISNCTVANCTLNSTDDGDWRVGVVAGTVNVGEKNDFSNITSSGNTLTQTGKTAPEGQSNLYGRFVPGTTGKLTIDGVAIG